MEYKTLSGKLRAWRADRPDEWLMDEFILMADELENQWVSVKERLPDKATWSGDRVLVYTEEGSMHTGLYEGEPADEWYDKFNDSGYITHWMPLPLPPEEEK